MGKKILFAICILVGIIQIGCSQMTPVKYHPISEVPEGPGLFTGEKGAVILTR